jgi:hypothetical protein
MVEVLIIERWFNFYPEPEGCMFKMSLTFSAAALLQNPDERNMKKCWTLLGV